MLLCSLLYLTGYKSVKLKETLRILDKLTYLPSHPEYIKNSGIETTTGPLGQGISNAVGFALAGRNFKKKLVKIL